ncbi:MCE family protein [Gordonia aichiensis]|uniref:Mce family protein n=1 Tax=Gordonia aichiensis NBRC 108223 TaxID=1220583 RepID=L7KG85_9ACTN|nr:MCE family protein [Gordonia aichiensis]GAC47900.1 Mce family protein [Gordonia aichiensis NBRC 108223]
MRTITRCVPLGQAVRRRARMATASAALVVCVASGCGWHGVESVRLPGGQGTGAEAYAITVDMPDVTNITANSPVLVNNVEVGRITSISLVDWHARLHLSLNGEVSLPANAVASIGQTSLLGSQHIELAPPSDTAPVGHLEPNAVIPIERAGAYPTTEQTLSALSVVVNGGGLAQLGDIVDGANDALAGRTDTVKDLVAQLTKTSTTIEARRGQISTALNGLDHLASVFADDAPTLDDAISRISPALTELVSRRQRLSDALTALDRFSDSAEHVISASASNVKSVVSDVAPFLKSLADSGDSITKSLDMAFTLPFPVSRLDRIVRGDYANLFALLDFTVPRMRSDLLRGTPLGITVSGPSGALGGNAGNGGEASDPITGPLKTPAPSAVPSGGR